MIVFDKPYKHNLKKYLKLKNKIYSEFHWFQRSLLGIPLDQ